MSQIFINVVGSSIIMIVTALIFGKMLLEEKLMFSKKKIIIVLSLTILYCFIARYLNGSFKTLSMCIIYALLFMYSFDLKCSKGIILTFMYTILTIIPDTLVVLFIIGILKVPPETFYDVYSCTIYPTLAVNILLILLVYIFRYWLRKLANVKISNNVEILMYSVLTLVSVVIIFYNAYNNIEVISKNLFVSSAIMFVFVIILYKLIRQKVENVNLIDKYDKLLEFIKKYEREIDIEKMLRHETKNQLITIRDKIINNDTYKIERYINSIIVEHVAFNEEKYSKFQFLPANGIKGLFYYKSMEAEAKGLKLSINVSKEVEKSNLSKLSVDEFKQLGRLIGIYLDNAIDASKKTKNKQMGIEIYMRGKDVEFIISNSFEGELDLESIGTKKYTTKGKNHGYGLMLAKRILNSYSCFESTRMVRGGIYSQSLIVKMKKINNKKEHLKLTD